MIFYHVDRRHSLKAGQVLQLAPPRYHPDNSLGHNLSVWGIHSVSVFGQRMIDCAEPRNGVLLDLVHPFIEENIEGIRRAFFSQMPSRFVSLFAVDELEHLIPWLDSRLFSEDPNPVIWRVSCNIDHYIVHDARFLRGDIQHQLFLDDRVLLTCMHYWRGVFSPNPLPEVILPLPVTVVSPVKSSELPSSLARFGR